MRYFGSENDNENKAPNDSKAPKGFEKFLRKTRKPGPQKGEETQAEEAREKSESKKEAKKEQADEEVSEEEEEPEQPKKEEKSSGYGQQISDFFISPENGGPKWENFGLITFLTGAMGYYLYNRGTPSEEITYMDFVNQYLN